VNHVFSLVPGSHFHNWVQHKLTPWSSSVQWFIGTYAGCSSVLWSKLNTRLHLAILNTFMTLTTPTHLPVFNQVFRAMVTHSSWNIILSARTVGENTIVLQIYYAEFKRNGPLGSNQGLSQPSLDVYSHAIFNFCVNLPT